MSQAVSNTPTDPEALNRELEQLRAREREIMELLGTRAPEKILHDLRNVLNEVQLLRALADQM
jgi:hypothetical protein